MTDRDASDSSPRSLLATRFVHAIADLQRSGRERRHAAELLSLFASERDAAQLEAVLLEPSEPDPWVRTYVLRAIVQQRLALTDRGLAWLSTATLDDRDGHGDFTAVLLAARSPEQDTIVHAAVREASAAVVRDVVLAAAGRATTFVTTARLPFSTRDLAYQRCRDLGLLDDTIAWATLDQPASQRRVLDRDPLDLVELAHATRDLAHPTLDAMFAERPKALQRALAGFALPASFVAARVEESVRHDNAVRLIDTVADQLVTGRPVRMWSAVRAALDALHEPARHLDAVVATRGPAVLAGIAWFRAGCVPAPDFDDFPLEVVHALLLRVMHDPLPRDRALLVWLANQPAPRLHHAGLRGLLLLDRGHVEPALIDRLMHSDEGLVRLLALEARLATGDDTARTALIEAAAHAPDVVQRAQALRSLRGAEVSAEVFRTALRGDHVSFDYYLPAVSEAALGLSRGAAITELEALTDLVDAHLAVDNDDAPHAIESSIRSWLFGTAATIRPVWYEISARRSLQSVASSVI